MEFDSTYFYIGSSVNLRSRIASWRHQILKNKPKNGNIRYILPSVKVINFSILEYCAAEIVRNREDFYIKENLTNINLLNCSPTAFGISGKRPQFGDYNNWKPKSEPINKKVGKFDMDNNFICTYDSLGSAARSVGISDGTKIASVALGKSKSVKKFIFKFLLPNGDFIEPNYVRKKVKRAGYKPFNWKINRNIYQKDLYGNIVCFFYSTVDASNKLGINRTKIWEVLSGKRKTYNGYIWEYCF